MMVQTVDRDGLCTHPLNSSCWLMHVTPKAVLIKTLMYCISMITVMLNLLVIISISHFRQLHTPTNLLILSLAVSDFIVGLTVMPGAVIQSCWYLGKILCALWSLLSFILTSSSVGTMVLISVDRYKAICDPLHYPSVITTCRVKICVSVCWVSSIIYNFIILKDNFSQLDMSDSCYQECSFIISYITGAVDFILTFLGPVIVMIVLYLRVFVVAVSQARVMHSQTAGVKSNTVSVKKSELRAARTLGIVLLVFILCLCPYYSPALAGQDTAAAEAPARIWLFFCNSTFNPLIYAFFYPWFRKAIKLIVSLQILQPGSCETVIM